MGLIFDKAFRILIWLGGHPSGTYVLNPPVRLRSSYQAFSKVCSVVNTWRKKLIGNALIPLATHSPGINGYQTEPEPELLTSTSETLHMIFSHYKCRWFSRVWVIQEAALARAALVLWDKCENLWD
ncbi:hypothetical protein B0J14DRAFT_562117 [Halenospora varia]|nr:hypothetical protein B0J14DRAFT_562117 [Halenospora varia]